MKIIESYCKNAKNINILNNLTYNNKKLLIDFCYEILFQKHGKMDYAQKILEHFNEIEIKKLPQINYKIIRKHMKNEKLDFYNQLVRNKVATLPLLNSDELKTSF